MDADPATNQPNPTVTPRPTPASPPALQFFDLPTELRMKVFRYLLPHGQTIEIGPQTIRAYYSPMGSPHCRLRLRLTQRPPELQNARNILSTCRRFRDEASDVLYGENVFRFELSRDRMGTVGLGNNLRWVPAAVLRRIWKCHIVVREELHRPHTFRRVRGWLKSAVDRLGDAHALRELHIDVQTGDFVLETPIFLSVQNLRRQTFEPWTKAEVAKGYQFVLEPLAQLRGINNVQITGHVDEGLAKTVGEVMGKEIGWNRLVRRSYKQHKVLKKKKHAARRTSMLVSTKKFWQPELDWGVVGEN